MAAITSAGIGSGIDIEGLVSQLVAAERAPATNRLAFKESRFLADLSGLGQLKGAMSQFQESVTALKNLSTFQARNANSANEELFTATASSSAVSGDYNIEVVKKAQVHKLMTEGFTDKNAVVGTGNLMISTGADSFTIEIDDSNKTLEGISQAINSAADNPGVTSTIINVDDGAGGTVSKLVFSATETGSDSALEIKVTNDGDGDDEDHLVGLSQLIFDQDYHNEHLTEINAYADLDAQIKIDGQMVTRSSNSIDDAIEGVTINLQKAEAGTEVALNVSLDSGGLNETISGFVSSYNSLVDTMKSLSKFDPSGGQSGVLLGDATLRNVQSQMRSAMASVVGDSESAFTMLNEIGITTTAAGTLEINTSKLNEAMDQDFDAIGALFASDNGIAARLDLSLSSFLDSDGVFESRTKGIQGSVERLSDQREVLDRRMQSLEARYRSQFIAMDMLLSQLQTTGGYLASQLENLPGVVRRSK